MEKLSSSIGQDHVFNSIKPWQIITFMVLIHCLCLTFPPVNQEFAFVSASQYFMTHNHEYLDQFFTYQANTLGLPYFAFILSKALPQIDTLVVIRLLNISGIFLLLAGLHNIAKLLQHPSTTKVLLLVALNPLVWAFSSRATADFMPASLALFAISIAPGKAKNIVHAVAAGLLLGIAAVFKYHALSLIVALAALLFIADRAQALKKLIITGLLAVIIVLTYALTVHNSFGFWFTPDKYQNIHHVHLSGVVNNLILYSGFLGLIVLPTFFLSEKVWKLFILHWKSLTALFFMLLVLGLSFVQDSGELNLGPLDSLLSIDLRIVLLSLMSLASVALAFPFGKDVDKNEKKLIGLAILFILIVFSSSRPAQRYLLFVIPFFALILPRDIFRSKPVYISTILLFIAANSFIELNRYATGSAAQKMVVELNKQHLLEVSLPGDIDSHVGNNFYGYRDQPKHYVVVTGRNVDAVMTASGGMFFYKKYFSLVSIDQSSSKSTD